MCPGLFLGQIQSEEMHSGGITYHLWPSDSPRISRWTVVERKTSGKVGRSGHKINIARLEIVLYFLSIVLTLFGTSASSALLLVIANVAVFISTKPKHIGSQWVLVKWARFRQTFQNDVKGLIQEKRTSHSQVEKYTWDRNSAQNSYPKGWYLVTQKWDSTVSCHPPESPYLPVNCPNAWVTLLPQLSWPRYAAKNT